MSLKLYTDKTEIFECNVELTGVPMSQSTIRAILELKDTKILVEGKITPDGAASINLPKLKNYAEEGEIGKMVLEVIADDAYFKPYTENFSVLTSNCKSLNSSKVNAIFILVNKKKYYIYTNNIYNRFTVLLSLLYVIQIPFACFGTHFI